MKFLLNKNSLKTTQRVWKTLVILTVCVLLLLPTPAAARVWYYSDIYELRELIAQTHRDIERERSIDFMSSKSKPLSIELLREKIELPRKISEKFQEIEEQILSRNEYLKQLIDKAQISYENNLERINQNYSEQERLTKELSSCEDRNRQLKFFYSCSDFKNSLDSLTNDIQQLEEENEYLSKEIISADQKLKQDQKVEQRIKLVKQKYDNIRESVQVTDSSYYKLDPDVKDSINKLLDILDEL